MKGAFEQAIGRSRGGRTTTLHALADDVGRGLGSCCSRRENPV